MPWFEKGKHMNRDTWQFTYTASSLAEAANAKIEFHRRHLEDWQQRRDEVMATIRAEGIEVSEKAALAYVNPKARDWMQGGDVMIRNDLRMNLAECYEKLAYHTGLRDQYDGCLQVHCAHPEDRLSLDINDWLFFFGRDVEGGG